METKKTDRNYGFITGMIILLAVQLIVVVWFGMQKQGYHYDEYYSYYSSNVTYALVPTDMEWKDTAEIRSEFLFLESDTTDYGMVKLMQSLDVHPPLYYYLLHTVCSFTDDIFSKWQGLSINIVFFILSWLTLAAITDKMTEHDQKKTAVVCALFGFSPAIFSGILFIRMYMMLTFACLLILFIHVNAIITEQRTITGFYLPVAVLSFLGFHIHYYFAVFLFFLAAATSLYLFFGKETRKESFLYAGSVLLGMAVSVALYPACLKHIFRGYRGTEAQDAFFDLSNIDDRLLFFFDLTNEYVFGGVLILLLLVWILLGLTKNAKQKTVWSAAEAEEPGKGKYRLAMGLVSIVSICYFLVVAKTALLNAEEAIRYEMPVYGLLILLVVVGIGNCFSYFSTEKNRKIWDAVFIGLMAVTLIGELVGLAQGKVCFLYPQDREHVEWAAEHGQDAVAYVYNTSNQWMIWDESEELMQYDEIYFISGDHEEVEPDDRLSSADSVYVYVMRGDAAEAVFEKLKAANGGFTGTTLIRELLYCDLYELQRQ